jgi:hypothetical protein
MERTVNKHTRKFYRVILEGIDSKKETPESFALKAALRLRMTAPRARILVRKLPVIVKSNMSSSEANKLKSVLEEMGGRCRLETHFVTPGEYGAPPEIPDMRQEQVEIEIETTGTFACPSCGSEADQSATYCPMCYRKFRDPNRRSKGLGANIPHDNPLEGSGFRPDSEEPIQPWFHDRRLWVVGGVILLVLLVLIIK